MKEKQVVVSGIRATGKLHLGNYLGAMRNFVDMQNEYNCFFFVADYHTLTTTPDPNQLRSNLPEVILDYLAAGLDPERCTLFAQSSVPEIAELSLLLSMVAMVGELQRCTTFKEKVRSQPENVNLGLLSYPVLMAADILIQKANLVPVGEDQLPHLEITRSLAKRFNHRYGETFPEPKALLEKAIRVPGLDGTEKMGKSEGNTIDLTDNPWIIKKKIAVAVTDPARKRRHDPGSPYECNLYALHEYVSSQEFLKKVYDGCRSADIGCVECKEELSRGIINLLTPFQEGRKKIASQTNYVIEVLRQGGLKARQSAQENIKEVREKMGLVMY
jgi:tryptophanyl-tRNA synthetase